MKITRWENCYDDSWKGFITNASFAHPAKYARGLIERIFDHCLERGYLKKGECVGDCFGGIGTGGIIAAYRGLEWVGCELEPKFVSLAEDNFELHHSKLNALGRPWPRIIQGNSRKFHVLIWGSDAVVSSPPFSAPNMQPKIGQGVRSTHGDNRNGFSGDRTAGNIETLKEGSVSGVISSPPYASALGRGGGDPNHPICVEKKISNGANQYGNSPGQIETLKEGTVAGIISSPPYVSGGHHPDQTGAWNKNGRGQGMTEDEANYGQSPGQIGQLKSGDVAAVVASPPWEKNAEGAVRRSKFKYVLSDTKGHGSTPAAKQRAMERDEQKTYGDSPGQIGKESGETYWQAMDAVYRSCFQAIKPGGVLILVVKDYVKGGKRVPLCDDTARLIEHIGFVMVERIHAMLVKETRHADMFDGETTHTKSRKSFFRRLAEKKGSPRIDFEEVLIAKRF